jgi:hypothetical protein
MLHVAFHQPPRILQRQWRSGPVARRVLRMYANVVKDFVKPK